MDPKSPSDAFDVDLNSGFMCHWSYWRPDPGKPDPQMPGLKQLTVTFIPSAPQDVCLCGSGKFFSSCCRAKRFWYPICPDP